MKSPLRSIIQPGILLLILASLPLSADNVAEKTEAPTLTLEPGETHESALQFGWEGDSITTLLWIANGATRQGIEDTFDLFGAHIDMATTFRGSEVTLARQQTSDAAILELPQTRWLAAASIALDSHSTIGIEYHRDRQYSGQRTNQSLLKLSTIF